MRSELYGVAAAVLIAAAVPAVASDKLLCISDKATGFKLRDTGGWEQVKFNVDDERYLVEKTSAPRSWVLKRFGATDIETVCELAGSITVYCGNFVRGGSSRGWEINLSTLRFIEYHGGGYVGDDSLLAGDVWITIGRCSRLE